MYPNVLPRPRYSQSVGHRIRALSRHPSSDLDLYENYSNPFLSREGACMACYLLLYLAGSRLARTTLATNSDAADKNELSSLVTGARRLAATLPRLSSLLRLLPVDVRAAGKITRNSDSSARLQPSLGVHLEKYALMRMCETQTRIRAPITTQGAKRRRRRALVAAALLCLARFKPHAHHVESTRRARRHASQRFILRSHVRLDQEIDESHARRARHIESFHFVTDGVYAVAIVEETLRPTSPIVRVSHGPQIALLGRAHEMLAGGGTHRASRSSPR